MIKSIYTNNNQHKKKIFLLCNLLNNIHLKIPSNIIYENDDIDVYKLIRDTTEYIKKDALGVFIPSDKLEIISEYIMSNMCDEQSLSIEIKPHSKNEMLNNKDGLCNISDADFAEIRVISYEETIIIYANSMNPILKKVGSYIEVKSTSWKKLPKYKTSKDKIDVILERILIEAALEYENFYQVKFKSREAFIKKFNKIEALEPNEIVNILKLVGITVDNTSKRESNLSGSNEALALMKMVYNKIKNNTLELKRALVNNDKTYIEFIYKNKSLEIELSMNEIKVTYDFS